ncbi:MAG: hypothetical protein IT257_04720, partial [Chitinophagaceae bacterium]|nr:hypothetical protein [Chitinophagaceae bacterium]
GGDYTINSNWYKSQSLSYDAWVNLTERYHPTTGQLLNNKVIEQLLDTEDLDYAKYPSALNSGFFDTLTRKFVHDVSYDHPDGKAYISKQAELALSVTNIDGLQSKIMFNQGPGALPGTAGQSSSVYLMKSAKDIAYFKLHAEMPGDPIAYIKNNYGAMPLRIASDKNELNFEMLADCLKATAAFPIGFRPRQLNRLKEVILHNPLLTANINASNIPAKDIVHTTWHVDGGAVNNEPFELAGYLYERRGIPMPNRNTLSNVSVLSNQYRDKHRYISSKYDISTILMVDPFPTNGDLEIASTTKLTMLQSALKILSALRMQPLVKTPEVNDAVSAANDYSKFMLAPRRKTFHGNGSLKREYNGDEAIACGLLGGFGGFLDKRFREHDYELGRFNCQHFMQKWFGIDTNANPKIVDPASFLMQQSQQPDLAYLKYTAPPSATAQATVIYPFIPDLTITKSGNKYTVSKTPMNGYTPLHGQSANAPLYPEWPLVRHPQLLSMLSNLRPFLKNRITKIAGQVLNNFIYFTIFKWFGVAGRLIGMAEENIRFQYKDREHLE